ncbi:histidine phosphatase family protein [Arthrobacter sp. ATA002]|uniref:histidine phosphatase family protein n=1 Tax=Arthrobacter sp. ATA002 TaxID=2991715 RepID=UPI0022A68CD1|nr:histidine phosphatase family protein [Arthrobacter sp. ATA002]WAP53216.1 histidine phosphatase family protein [Arthrobacter sp. ATA002]
MVMPRNLFLIRHGQSEANIMQRASTAGDPSMYNEETMTVPDRSWRLTELGVQQARVAGAWITGLNMEFDRALVSTYTRARETAAHLGLDVRWEENRVIRERSWGEIGSMSKQDFARKYSQNAAYRDSDPLYWAPPAGESIAQVAENRVRNILSTLHRENARDNVLLVTHGEFMWATRLVLERWSDEEFLERDGDREQMIHNCTVLQYTGTDPANRNNIREKLSWVRRCWPVQIDGEWTMCVGEWEEFDRAYFTGRDLLEKVESNRHFFQDVFGS